jgi:hypothetical protein
MALHDPNMLNPYVLLDPHFSVASCLAISVISAFLGFVISWSYYKSYRFFGFGHLLGIPTGFTFLGLSYLFQYISLIFRINDLLYPELFWIQLTLQSNGLALIAISYRFKVRNYNGSSLFEPHLEVNNSSYSLHQGRFHFNNIAKNISTNSLFIVLILIPFIVPVCDLNLKPYFDYTGLADLALIMTIFNMIVLAYILKNIAVSLINEFNAKFAFGLIAFTLLWLEQYSLLLVYCDNSSISFTASIVTRLGGLLVFAYLIYYAKSFASKRVTTKIEKR